MSRCDSVVEPRVQSDLEAKVAATVPGRHSEGAAVKTRGYGGAFEMHLKGTG